MQLRCKQALVTGGAGFIGSHLVDQLVAHGCGVVVMDNLSTGHLANLDHLQDKIRFVEADIRDSDRVMAAAEGCDAIFHLAAVVSVQQTIDDPVASAMTNEMGTLNILEAARQHGIQTVVFSSSCAVYGFDPELPKKETMTPQPASPYAVQKYTGELYARVYYELHGIRTVCLRYFNVYGPRQDPSSPYSGVISIFMNKAVNGARPLIYGDGNQYRDFIFVKDVVNANLLAAGLDAAAGQVLNIGTGKFVRINQLWQQVQQLAGIQVTPEYGPRRPGDIVESVADIAKATTQLGFAPQFPFDKGLRETFQWYQQQA